MKYILEVKKNDILNNKSSIDWIDFQWIHLFNFNNFDFNLHLHNNFV